ncbi:MAG: hypothetical protein LC808_09725 [Actinobacteria bacterium]|nr:hypothetical protein [Actinomycetota bacterium]
MPVMVRTPDELASILERLPFRSDAYDERRLQVAFLPGAPPASTPARIAGADGEEWQSSRGAKPSCTERPGPLEADDRGARARARSGDHPPGRADRRQAKSGGAAASSPLSAGLAGRSNCGGREAALDEAVLP